MRTSETRLWSVLNPDERYFEFGKEFTVDIEVVRVR